jgi:hypothetical protein
VEIIDHQTDSRTLAETYGYQAGWGHPGDEMRKEIETLMNAT